MKPAESRFRTVERSNPSFPMDGLRFITAKSPVLHQRADVTLFVPPQAQGITNLPIVILLHGVYGSHWSWALQGGAHITAARLIEEGTLPPVALLMPSDGLWGDGSGYVAHRAQDFERWIVDDVPALAIETINGCSAQSPLCIAGLSMGGFGALRLAGKHPRRFVAAAAHSAMTDIMQFDGLVEDDRSDWNDVPADRSVIAALTDAPAPLPPIRFDCGRDDPYVEGNRALHAALAEAGIAHRYVEHDGEHDWPYWTAAVEGSLRFFGNVLRGDMNPFEEEEPA